MKKYLIYQITNKLNNYIYIGCHITENINDKYMGTGTNILKAIKEIGKENFIKEILFIYNNKQEMLDKEAELVNKKFVSRLDTYNISLGGGQFFIYNHVTVKDKDGNTQSVNIKDPKYLSGELIHICKNTFVVQDKNNNISRVNINDERVLSGELKSIHKNKITTKDKYGNTFRVNIDDKRILSGELVGISKGLTCVKDKDNNILHIDINNPKYISGEYIHINSGYTTMKNKNGEIKRIHVSKITDEYVGEGKGKMTVKDINGNTFRVNIDDERVLSGELKNHRKGTQCTNTTKLKMSGKKCIYNPITNIKTRIKTELLEQYLNDGWVLGWNKN